MIDVSGIVLQDCAPALIGSHFSRPIAAKPDVTDLIAVALRFLMHAAVVVADALIDPEPLVMNTPRPVALHTASACPSDSLTRVESDVVLADAVTVADPLCTRSPDAVELTAVAETMVCRSALSYTL